MTITLEDLRPAEGATHKIKRVEATRMINCNSESRGKIKELLISNF